VPALLERDYTLGLRWDLHHEGVRRVGHLILPATIGVAADQVNAFVDTVVATFLSVGSVTALYYSNRVMQLPLALFGVALSQVALPAMSAAVARGAAQEVKDTLNFALRLTMFMILPATVGLIVLGHPIVQVLFQYGKFSENASAMTTWALIGFSVGLYSYAAVKIIASAFYAHQSTRIPVVVASACVGLNVVMDVTTLIIRSKLSLSHPDWAPLLNGRLGVACLAFNTSVSSWVNAGVLFILLRKRLGFLGGGRILRTTLKSMLGCTAMTAFCWGILHMHLSNLNLVANHMRIAQGIELLIAIAGGVSVYMLFAKLLHMEEWNPFWSQLSSRHLKTQVVETVE
jgi:putative peptidoglycan lipid II flippase